MKNLKLVITVSAVLCVSLANTEVLRAIHMHQQGGFLGACDTSRPGEKQHPVGHHDPDKCPFCIQSGSAKTVPPSFAELVSFTTGSAQEAAPLRTSLSPTIFLPSSSPRAPPFISL
jgi:hypothetical protein